MVREVCGHIPPSALLAKDFLNNNGWCLVHAARLLESEDIQNIYIAAAVTVHFETSFNHINCTKEDGCAPSNIDNATFQASHARRNCQCAMGIPDMHTAQSTLQQGLIPVVELRRDQSGKYCNLRNKEPSTVWIDAFCIPCCDPTTAEQSLALRRKAIQPMNPTYAGAFQVLVIEKNLEALNYLTHGMVVRTQRPIYAWLFFSPWGTRCWTLQERSCSPGALARRCKWKEATPSNSVTQ